MHWRAAVLSQGVSVRFVSEVKGGQRAIAGPFLTRILWVWWRRMESPLTGLVVGLRLLSTKLHRNGVQAVFENSMPRNGQNSVIFFARRLSALFPGNILDYLMQRNEGECSRRKVMRSIGSEGVKKEIPWHSERACCKNPPFAGIWFQPYSRACRGSESVG